MKRWPYPRWIAHRGAGKLAPENTLAAFRLGEEYGYRMFECDVRLSQDGELFLLHDATLDRTTTGSGPAAVHQWSALSRLDAGVWHSPHYAGEPICHLESLARFILSKGLALNIEMKPNPGQAKETGHAVTQVVRRLWSGQAAPWPLLSSFQIDALAAAQASAPELPRALLLQQLESGWLECARDLGCVAVVMHHSIVSQEQIQRLHEVGMRALSYTVNDDAIATTLWSMGMDGLITDAVDRFLPFESEDAAQQDAVVPSDTGPGGPASTVS